MTDEEKLITICDDRFEIISKAKKHIIEATNIEMSPKEMEVLDNFLFRCWQMGWLKNDYKALEIENAKLKEQLKNNPYVIQLQKEKSEMAEDFAKQIKNLEEDKEQIIFESDLKIKALEEMIEKMKCCQMCKYLEHNGSCLRADKDEVNKWGDFLIGTRRKNHCKYWELAK